MVDFRLKQELLCSICMEIYLDPTTLRCGHSFCIPCISKTWDNQEGECTCPECRWKFRRRPELKINVRLRNIAKYIHFPHPKQEETNLPCSYTPDLTVNVSSTHEDRLVENLQKEIDKELAEKGSTNSPEKSKLSNLREAAKDYKYEETMDYHLNDDDRFNSKKITKDGYQFYDVDTVTIHEMVAGGEKVVPQQQRRMREQGKSCELCDKVNVLLRELKDQVELTLERIQSDISNYKEKLSSHFLHFTLRRTEL